MQLFKISEELLKLVYLCETGEIGEEEFVEKVKNLDGDFKFKIDDIASLVKNINAEINAIKEEIKNQQARVKAKEKQVESLTKYLETNLKMLDLKKVETARNVVSFKKCPPRVVIANEEEFIKAHTGTEMIKVKEVKSIDKIFIKEQLKQGNTVEFANLEQDVKINIK